MSFVEIVLFLILSYGFYKLIGKKLVRAINIFVKEFFDEGQ